MKMVSLRARVFMGLTIGAVLGGCVSDATLNDVYQQYQRGQYQRAFDQAKTLLRAAGSPDRQNPERDRAAYMAGLAAYRLDRFATAKRYLDLAQASNDSRIAGDALATLGLLHSTQRSYDAAAQALLEAAKRLEGEQRAQSYYYAAIAYQKLGRWPAARLYLARSKNQSRDPDWRRKIEQANATFAWTIQTGAFRERPGAAREADRVNRITGRAARLVRAIDQDGSVWYLVQFGEFDSYAEALGQRDQLGLRMAKPAPLAKQP